MHLTERIMASNAFVETTYEQSIRSIRNYRPVREDGDREAAPEDDRGAEADRQEEKVTTGGAAA